MKLPFSRWPMLAAALFTLASASSASASAKEFDGIWSVSIVGNDESCPTHTIPVQVSDGTISFSSFGATGNGKVNANGAIRLKISVSEQTVRISGRAHGRAASGNWRMAGCEGHWSAQITD